MQLFGSCHLPTALGLAAVDKHYSWLVGVQQEQARVDRSVGAGEEQLGTNWVAGDRLAGPAVDGAGAEVELGPAAAAAVVAAVLEAGLVAVVEFEKNRLNRSAVGSHRSGLGNWDSGFDTPAVSAACHSSAAEQLQELGGLKHKRKDFGRSVAAAAEQLAGLGVRDRCCTAGQVSAAG